MKRYITTILTLLLIASCALAQWAEPAKFAVSHKVVDDKEVVVTFKGTIDPGWHVYSTDVGDAGPTAASFNIDESKGLKPIGKLRAVGQPIRKFDQLFNAELSYFENSCTFVQRLAITEPEYSLKGYLEYGACNDRNCMPPTSVEVEFDGAIAESQESSVESQESESAKVEEADSSKVQGVDSLRIEEQASDSALWSSKTAEIKAMLEDTSAHSDSPIEGGQKGGLFWLFLMGFVGGLIAVLTPCVWPIIPMTVSFFLKRSENKKRGIQDAIIYGISIVVI